jgi:hypothetical protein
MLKSTLGLVLTSTLMFGCDAGSISEPGPATLDEATDNATEAELSSSELRYRSSRTSRRRSGSGSGAGATGGQGGTASGAAGSPTNPGTGSGGGIGAGSTVGAGDIHQPVNGPGPVEAAHLGGAPFVLVKNWDFGADGTIRSYADLTAEFEYHDQFGTIANGTHYGAVMVAPTQDTAISYSGLNLPGNQQPLDTDASRPFREWTSSTLKTYVRPLSTSQADVSVNAHNAGCGSFMAKWKLPSGGSRLGYDVVWETRVRMPKPLAAYWFALWTSGNQWNGGAEMDVVEAFGASHIFANAFHSDSVGGTNSVNYASWPDALGRVGVPTGSARDLREWHTWTWVYRKDNSYEVYYDGYRVQYGAIQWTNGGGSSGTPIDMRFLFDLGWGHTDIADVNVTLPASTFEIQYELDYSRVYLR